jgi:CopG family transcriptional regulator/antitoxin EndoAI
VDVPQPNKRINVVLPETTLQTIDRMVKPGERSRFIDQAVQHFVSHKSTEALRIRMEQTAVRDRDLDREISADWFAVDKEAWQTPGAKARKRLPTRGAAKSTSRRLTRQ